MKTSEEVAGDIVDAIASHIGAPMGEFNDCVDPVTDILRARDAEVRAEGAAKLDCWATARQRTRRAFARRVARRLRGTTSNCGCDKCRALMKSAALVEEMAGIRKREAK